MPYSWHIARLYVRLLLVCILTFLMGIIVAPTAPVRASTTVDMVSIPNGNLERYLIQIGADPGPVDGLVPRAGILLVTTLDLSNNRIEDLRSINEFKNLETLIISGNTVAQRLEIESLSRLRIIDARNTKLEAVWISAQSLVSVDLSGNVNLEHLAIGSPILQTLLVSPSAELESLSLKRIPDGALPALLSSGKMRYLSLSGATLESLDTSRFPLLERLEIRNSSLTTIDLSLNPSLREVSITNSRLLSVSFGVPAQLTALDLSGNRLRSIDLSRATGLQVLDVRANRIRRLDVSANQSISRLNVAGNPLRRLDVSGLASLGWLDISYTNLGRIDLRSTNIIGQEEGFTSFGTRARVIVSNARLARVQWARRTDDLVTFISR